MEKSDQFVDRASPLPERPGGDRLLTLEEFKRLPEEDGYLLELVRGRLVREPRPQAKHGWVATQLFRALDTFVEKQSLGIVIIETGFLLFDDPPTVRGPDVSFISSDNIPPEGIPDGFWRNGPDLAAEVLSPSNTVEDVQEKVLEYMEAGSRLIWVVHPRNRTVTVYRSREDISVLVEGDALDGEDVLPGFRLPISELFQGL